MKNRLKVISLSILLALGCMVSASAGNTEETIGLTATASTNGVSIQSKASSKVKIGSVKLQYKSITYTGKPLKPSVTVTAKVNGKTKTLRKGTDYSVTYSNNISVGTATVTVKGKGSYYGTKTASFKIVWKEPKSITDPIHEWNEYDSLIQQIRSEKDKAARVALMHRAEDMLMSTYAVIPLYYYDRDLMGTYFIAFNVKSKLFSNLTPGQAVNVRKAVSILINRKDLMSGFTPASTFVPVGMSDGNGGIFHKNNKNGYYDPLYVNKQPKAAQAEARELLMSAGYLFGSDGKLSAETPLTIPYLYNTDNKDNAHAVIAKSIAKDLKKIGIKLKTSGISWNALQKKWSQGKFTASRSGWVSEVNDPIGMLEAFTTDNREGNMPHFGGW